MQIISLYEGSFCNYILLCSMNKINETKFSAPRDAASCVNQTKLTSPAILSYVFRVP